MSGVLAIDYGVRKTGLASADPTRISLQALETVRTRGDDEILLRRIAALLEEREVATLLVGLPLDPEGREGDQARIVQRFVARLRERFPSLAVRTHDERLTTVEAETRLRELGYDGREIQKRKDAWSALILLEDWLRSGEPG